jgi:hypothetical protein
VRSQNSLHDLLGGYALSAKETLGNVIAGEEVARMPRNEDGVVG